MDFCLFSQGVSSEFAWILETPYTTHPVKKGGFCENVRLSSVWRSECQMYCRAQRPWVLFVSLGVTLDSAETSPELFACSLLRPFAVALFCAHLRSSACFCVRPRSARSLASQVLPASARLDCQERAGIASIVRGNLPWSYSVSKDPFSRGQQTVFRCSLGMRTREREREREREAGGTDVARLSHCSPSCKNCPVSNRLLQQN